MKISKTQQAGFTLVELIVVIVLLGILGATALGKFQDLSGNAQNAANQGVASELSGAASTNYAASLLNAGSVTAIAPVASGTAANQTCNTALLGGLFANGAFPTGFTAAVTDATVCTGGGDTYTCDISGSGGTAGTAATATVICTGP